MAWQLSFNDERKEDSTSWFQRAVEESEAINSSISRKEESIIESSSMDDFDDGIDNARMQAMVEASSLYDVAVDRARHEIYTEYNIDPFSDGMAIVKNKDAAKAWKNKNLKIVKNAITNYLESKGDLDTVEAQHINEYAKELERQWDALEHRMFQESTQVLNYMPINALQFPALVKQYYRLCAKDLIPVSTVSNPQTKITINEKYIRDNDTGLTKEIPRVFFEKDADGVPEWKKFGKAGMGPRFNYRAVLPISTIQAATDRKYKLWNWMNDDSIVTAPGATYNPLVLPAAQQTFRTHPAMDLSIKYVKIADTEVNYYKGTNTDSESLYVTSATPAEGDTVYSKSGDEFTPVGTATAATSNTFTYESEVYTISGSPETVTVTGEVVKLPKNGIAFDISSGGYFNNVEIQLTDKLDVMELATSGPRTGEWVNTGRKITGISDSVNGKIDFVRCEITVTSCGTVSGIILDGHMSNETNLKTIGYVEFPTYQIIQIPEARRFQLSFTQEDFASAASQLSFPLANRLINHLAMVSDTFEDADIKEALEIVRASSSTPSETVFDNSSYTMTEYADFDPTFISPTFAGDPFEYRTNILYNALRSLILSLCDKAKMDNLGFVVYGNPKVISLLKGYVKWTWKSGETSLAGTKMNYSAGLITDMGIPVRVVSSNTFDPFVKVDDYTGSHEGSQFNEYYLNVVAYPMDDKHITTKHLRWNNYCAVSPNNAQYRDPHSPGGEAAVVTQTSSYLTYTYQGITGRVVCHNSALAPDAEAGLIS